MRTRFWDLSRTHPFLVVLLTVGVLLLSFSVALTVATALYALFTDLSLGEVFALGEKADSADPSYAYFTLLLADATQVLGFGLTAWLVATGYPRPTAALGLRPVALWPAVVAASVWILASQPLFSSLSFDADSFELPAGLKGFEQSAEAFEAEAAEQFKGLFQTIPLPLALLSIALLPAVCEELLFRGLLLSVLRRWLGVHAAVWVQGLLFSLLHLQVFGFFPRWLMGVAFGYLRVSSGSIVPAVVAHLVNNAVAVVAAYRFGLEIGETEPLTGLDWLWVAVSTLASVGLLVWLYRTRPSVLDALPDPTRPHTPADESAVPTFDAPEDRG